MRHLDFFNHQLNEWPLAQKNYESQRNAVVRDCHFGGTAHPFRIRLVCLPERIGSSSAKITAKGQVNRPCFLCAHRLPPEQKSLPIDEDFSLLVNPFPVFPQHFTIPAVKHQAQRLRPYLSRFIGWAGTMPDMVLFYNGGRCGASAPDHLHFQAGNQGLMPMQGDFADWKPFGCQSIHQDKYLEICELKDMLRQGWVFEAAETAPLSQAIALFLDAFEHYQKEEIRERHNHTCGNGQEDSGRNAGEENLGVRARVNGKSAQPSSSVEDADDFLADDHVNLLCWYDKNSEDKPIKAILFPRAKHRPSCFFEEDESRRRVTSPASVEMGGYYILPRREDFERMQDEELVQIYKEVCLEPDTVREISRKALSNFTSK